MMNVVFVMVMVLQMMHDCDGNVLDDCGVCGGTGTDFDQDGICDDVDDV